MNFNHSEQVIPSSVRNAVRQHFLSACLVGLAALFCSASAQAGNEATHESLEKDVSGLWLYTGLTTGDGTEMPLTGVFLFKDGVFIQQAVFDDGDFSEARAMAHAGPYRTQPDSGSVHLVAEQTISTSPVDTPALSFRADTDHDVTVTREGETLTLIFGMGTSTVQSFSWVGPGTGAIHRLEDGMLAFSDNYFVLVEGDENSVTTGYGTYQQDGDDLTLKVIRWSEADESGARNFKDIQLDATFDGQVLDLGDGRSFSVISG